MPTTLRMCKRHGHGWFIVFVNLCSTTKIRSCKKVASVVEWVVRESSFPHLQIVSKLCSANTHCVLPQFCLGQPFFSVCLLFGKFVVTPSQKLVFNPVSADQRYFFYLFPLCSRSDTSPLSASRFTSSMIASILVVAVKGSLMLFGFRISVKRMSSTLRGQNQRTPSHAEENRTRATEVRQTRRSVRNTRIEIAFIVRESETNVTTGIIDVISMI